MSAVSATVGVAISAMGTLVVDMIYEGDKGVVSKISSYIPEESRCRCTT